MSDAKSDSADRVNRALAGELPSEDLTDDEACLFDSEIDSQLMESMAGDDLTLPENRSNEPIGGMGIGPDGEIILIAPNGDTFISSNEIEPPPEPMCSFERDGDLIIVTVFLEGTPVAVEATSFDEAITKFVEDLREYAADWSASPRLQQATNHRDNRALVEAVESMSDEELNEWARGLRGLNRPS